MFKVKRTTWEGDTLAIQYEFEKDQVPELYARFPTAEKQNYRFAKQANGNFKFDRVDSSCPDIDFSITRDKWNNLFIEKRGDNRSLVMQKLVKGQGYLLESDKKYFVRLNGLLFYFERERMQTDIDSLFD